MTSKVTSRQSKSNNHLGFKVFVGGLSVNCEDKELREYLQRFGLVMHCSINRDSTGVSKGYAFATFKYQKDQLRSVGKQHVICGKPFEIRVLVDAEKNASLLKEIAKRKVFISNLKDTLTEAEISKQFAKFGAIEEVLISRDPATQQSKGFGFVVFQRIDSIDKVFNGRQKRIVKIYNHDVIVREAIPKMDIEYFKKDHPQEHEHYHIDEKDHYDNDSQSIRDNFKRNHKIIHSNEDKSQHKLKYSSVHSQDHSSNTKNIPPRRSGKDIIHKTNQDLRDDDPQESDNYVVDQLWQTEQQSKQLENTYSGVRNCQDTNMNRLEMNYRPSDSAKVSQEQHFPTTVKQNLAFKERHEGGIDLREISQRSFNISSLDSLHQSPLLSTMRHLPDRGVQGYYINTIGRKESLDSSSDPTKSAALISSLPMAEVSYNVPPTTGLFMPKNICLCGIDSLQNTSDSNIVHFMNSKRCTCRISDISQVCPSSKWYENSAGFTTQATSNHHSFADLSRSTSFNNYETSRHIPTRLQRRHDYDSLHGFSLSSSKYKLLSRHHGKNRRAEPADGLEGSIFDDAHISYDYEWCPQTCARS